MNDSIKYSVLGLVVFIIVFFSTRGYIEEVISYLYNKNAEKKKKKGQSFIDWFCYKKFKDKLPKKFYVWYYANFAHYFLFNLCIFTFKLLSFNYFKIIFLVYFFSASLPIFYYRWMTKTLYFNVSDMENIVHKKHGNKKKKK